MSAHSDDESETLSEGSGADNHPMMSIFASYYGIEEPATEKRQRGTIDDANFDTDGYVKDLLVNESVERLMEKDTSMVHDIRTLDGEMQKLVYDNYNKFITATETIRDMKTNVFKMDSDMEAVKLRMQTIASNSIALDDKFQEKRNQVDKLVRIRRLLNRLEFLSELPERLEKMIDHKFYKEAVQLYNKTITVLTRHSHVLSFKNIKERTEMMMKDLTEKVTNMLDDPTLEDVKLTHYVGVLRLMRAPRAKVMQKLLSAHKSRAMRMVISFQRDLRLRSAPATAPPTNTVEEASNVVLEILNDISNARKFHQSLLVGLIEACKGIHELYQPSPGSDGDQKDGEEAVAARQPSQDEESFNAEEHAAFQVLHSTISDVMGEYSRAILTAFQQFFDRYQLHFTEHPVDYVEHNTLHATIRDALQSLHSTVNTTDSSDLRRKDSAASMANSPEQETKPDYHQDPSQVRKFKFAELEEERSCWFLLARQLIKEVQLLDATKEECAALLGFRPIAVGSSAGKKGHRTAGGDNTYVGHAEAFIDQLLQEMHRYCDLLQLHRIRSVLAAIGTWTPQLIALYQFASKRVASDELAGKNLRGAPAGRLGVSTSSDPTVDRQTLQKHSQVARSIVDMLFEFMVQSFHDAAKDLKPLVEEIYSIADRRTESVSIQLVSRHHNVFAMFVESVCQIANHRCTYDPVTNKLEYTGAAESGGDQQDGDAKEGDDLVIYVERDSKPLSAKEDPLMHSLRDAFARLDTRARASTQDSSSGDAFAAYDLQLPQLLVYAAVARKCIQSFMAEVRNILRDEELPGIEGRIDFKDQCTQRLQLCAQLLLKHFIEVNANYAASALADIQHQVYTSHYTTPRSAVPAAVTVSDDILHLTKYVDLLGVACCVVLSEAPPQVKVAEATRRASTMRGSVTGMHNIQQDIERLFSQRSKVFDQVTAGATLDTIVGTVLKAALKSTQETVRMMTISAAAYLQLQANTTFIKYAGISLLRESLSDCDNSVEQILSAIFSRYLEANDIANATDGNEASLINRAVTEGFQKLQRTNGTILIVKTA